ncbi:MAG: CBS domain-containing protein [Bacilli bacterium]|nr:CBS domain-containing protein [Bacilli bacterium]
MISNIMSKSLITSNINSSFKDIAFLMKKYDIGFIPISNGNKIVGVITDRDIVVNAISNNINVNEKVESYINKRLIYINSNDSIDTALKVMSQEKIKRLLIVEDRKVVGILSLSDIINKNIDNDLLVKTLKMIWEIDKNDDIYETEIDEFYL